MSALEMSRIYEAARAQFDLTHFGNPIYEPALAALVQSIDAEAEIEPMRELRTAMQLVMLLGMRARIDSTWRAYPEILQERIEAPIFVVGLPRTGTTLLHNLLAGHEDHRAPKLWEMRAPVPSADADTAIAESKNLLSLLYELVPELQKIHPMNAEAPDECSWLFRHDFASLVYAFTYFVPGYVNYLTSTDMEPHYRFYRGLLQMLQFRAKSTRRWVLKDPCHLWHVDALFRVFPDARVVMLHRSLDEALPSMASLCHALHRVESRRADPRAMGPYCMDLADRGLHSMMRLRPVMPGVNILDVHYARLVADPVATLREICTFAGVRSEPAELEPMIGWLRLNRQHAAGRHEYSLEQFGFDRAQIRARFARYEERFAVPASAVIPRSRAARDPRVPRDRLERCT